MSPAGMLPRSLRELYVLLRAIVIRFYEERCLQVAGSLTFTTLLALVPLITVALALMSAFPVFAAWTGQLEQFMLENLLPEAIGQVITGYFLEFTEKAGQLTALGVSFLAITALMMMLTIDQAFNQIFRVHRLRSLVQQLLIYWAALTLGPILFGASLTMTSYLVTAPLGFAAGLPVIGALMLALVPVVLTVVALTLLYMIVPNRRVHLRHALAGGLIAGLAFELTKRGFAIYVAQFPTYTLVYGAFAAMPIFLLWMYLSWAVVLVGAVITALLPGYRYADERRGTPGMRFAQALDILGRLLGAQGQGRPVSLTRLANEARMPPESCERLLERMDELHWVARTSGDGWLLARDPHEIRLADVYRAFVFAPEAPQELLGRLNVDPLLEIHRAGMAGSLNVSLKEFFTRNEPADVRSARAA
jgi:membrane protein